MGFGPNFSKIIAFTFCYKQNTKLRFKGWCQWRSIEKVTKISVPSFGSTEFFTNKEFLFKSCVINFVNTFDNSMELASASLNSFNALSVRPPPHTSRNSSHLLSLFRPSSRRNLPYLSSKSTGNILILLAIIFGIFISSFLNIRVCNDFVERPLFNSVVVVWLVLFFIFSKY